LPLEAEFARAAGMLHAGGFAHVARDRLDGKPFIFSRRVTSPIAELEPFLRAVWKKENAAETEAPESPITNPTYITHELCFAK
jgi:hypothetical protein